MDDVACSFAKHKINLSELEEYINWVDTPEFKLKKHLTSNMNGEVENFGQFIAKCSTRSADGGTSSSALGAQASSPQKTLRQYLGYCNDPNNKELLDRQSDEEYEHVYDYMPLMTQLSKPTKTGTCR